jgi:hypothetical protein
LGDKSRQIMLQDYQLLLLIDFVDSTPIQPLHRKGADERNQERLC